MILHHSIYYYNNPIHSAKHSSNIYTNKIFEVKKISASNYDIVGVASVFYPQDIVDEVRALNDIVDVISGYVPLRSAGANHMGLCPFHNEKTPSFSVSAEKQIFRCFGCGAGGNVFSFIMRIENLDFSDTLKQLADRVHFNLPQQSQSNFAKQQSQIRERIAEINKSAGLFFYETLQAETKDAASARSYLDKRGVPPGLRKRFGLGLSPDGWDAKLNSHLLSLGFGQADINTAGLVSTGKNDGKRFDRFRGRLMFPILDAQNRVAGFGGRVMGDGEPKYLNSPETPLFDKSRILYGWNAAKKKRPKEIILVEGYMDVIGLHSAGFTNTSGALGTALTSEHARLLKRGGVESAVLLMDSDKAGTEATLRAIPILLDSGLKVRVLQVTDAKDPDEYIRKYGAEEFAVLLRRASGHVAFRVGLLKQKYNLRVTEQRISFTQEAAGLLAALPSEIETDAYISDISAATGIAAEAISAEVKKQQVGNVPKPLRRNFASSGKSADKGLREAKKSLISLIFTSHPACMALKNSGVMSPDELGGGVASKLLAIAFDTEGKLQPADAIARFDSVEEQQQAAELLNADADFRTRAETEKALNEIVLLLKRSWIECQMEELGEKDMNAVNILLKSKRKITSLYITMTDG